MGMTPCLSRHTHWRCLHYYGGDICKTCLWLAWGSGGGEVGSVVVSISMEAVRRLMPCFPRREIGVEDNRWRSGATFATFFLGCYLILGCYLLLDCYLLLAAILSLAANSSSALIKSDTCNITVRSYLPYSLCSTCSRIHPRVTRLPRTPHTIGRQRTCIINEIPFQ